MVPPAQRPGRARCRRARPRIRPRRSRVPRRPIAQARQGSIGPFDPPICRIDWHSVTCAPCGVPPPVTACTYCGRDNEPGARACMDCGKPMDQGTKGGAMSNPGTRPLGAAAGVTTGESLSCPFCGGRASAARPFCPPFGPPLSAPGPGPARPPCGPPAGTAPPFCAPRGPPPGGTGAAPPAPPRLGYPGPHPPDADATRRMGSLIPSADIASLTQLRSDGSARDVLQLSPGRDVMIGREQGDWIFPYDPSMSARHAVVRSEDADFVVVDAESRNGVALAARGDMPLRHNSRVLVGDKLLRIELPA